MKKFASHPYIKHFAEMFTVYYPREFSSDISRQRTRVDRIGTRERAPIIARAREKRTTTFAFGNPRGFLQPRENLPQGFTNLLNTVFLHDIE